MAGIRYRFGLFEFDRAHNDLRREGMSVRLQAQPAQVLACLLENAGTIVSREQLRHAVWKDDTFVDFERGLNFCIAQIRSALDDEAASPRFVRTIPKRGYQFIAPVAKVVEDAQTEHGAAPKPSSMLQNEGGGVARIWRRAALCAAAVLLLAIGYWVHARYANQPLPIVAVVRFDNETGDAAMNVFSDGLTDSVVADLTMAGDGHYRVIGNAGILRTAREQRDLKALAQSLGATYVVLGQVQANGDKTRVLAHLIHLPEQTHVSVARLDRTIDDRLAVESQLSQSITAQFSPRIAAHATSRNSSAAASR